MMTGNCWSRTTDPVTYREPPPVTRQHGRQAAAADLKVGMLFVAHQPFATHGARDTCKFMWLHHDVYTEPPTDLASWRAREASSSRCCCCRATSRAKLASRRSSSMSGGPGGGGGPGSGHLWLSSPWRACTRGPDGFFREQPLARLRARAEHYQQQLMRKQFKPGHFQTRMPM